MAGGGRNRLVRSSISNPSRLYHNTNITQTNEENKNKIPTMKHVRLPNIPLESKLIFELIHFFHIILILGLSYLHFYRNVWWLNSSFNFAGMNFYLIDQYVVYLVLVIEGRRLLYLIFKSFLVVSVIMLTLLGLIFYNLESTNTNNIIYLLFPIIIHINVHGVTNWRRIFERNELEDPLAPNNIVVHICNVEASQTRREVEELKNLFNQRLKSVIASSFTSVYFACFLPWSMVQPFVFYDLHFVGQHLIISWMIIFSLLASRSFNPIFNDCLHKVAWHLGTWTKLKPTHIPSNLWNGDFAIEPGAIVKHQRELYKAGNIIHLISEPGNQLHSRFQALFLKGCLTRALLGFHISLILILLIILIKVSEWYKLISSTVLILASLYTLIRLMRDFLITWKIYNAEEIIVKCSSQ